MRKWAKRSAATALALFALLAAAAGVFLERPGLLLTSRTVGAAVKLLGGPYSPRWSSLAFSAVSIGGGRHRYALRADDVCAQNAAANGCFSRLELSVVVRYTPKGPRVALLEKLAASGGAVSVDLRRRAPGATAKPPSAGLLTIPARSLRVEIPEFALRAEKYELQGGISAALAPGSRRPVAVDADLTARSAGASRRIKAAFVADTDLFQGAEPTFLEASARAEVRGLGRARAAVSVRRANGRYEGTGGAELTASTGPLRGLRLSNCRGFGAAPSAEASCRFEFVPSLTGGRFDELKNVSGRARLKTRVRDGSLSAVLAADLEPVAAWYELTGGLEASLEGRLDRPFAEMTLRHEASARIKTRFEKLVSFLRGTKYAVPAPVHVLEGPLAVTLESRGDPRDGVHRVRYALWTELGGPRQRLVTRASGLLTASGRAPERAFEHEGQVLLKEVALELPRLAIGPAPKVAMDKRIRSAAPAGAGARRSFAPRSRVAIRTEKPLILFSNLAKDPVPVALDFVATYPPAAASGLVGVREFGVELFRRRATVDHLDIAVSSAATAAGLDGLVLYRTPSAVISIRILGTTARPRVELTSAPPLKREDIIALLIFGKNPDELDPEQAESVSNTRSALESRAFGLASLYLFGSAPIERVAYDSATNTATVKVRLPGGAQLTVGSDFDRSRQLSVRKSLAPRWAIQSEITEQGEQSRAATTFLEWFNRY